MVALRGLSAARSSLGSASSTMWPRLAHSLAAPAHGLLAFGVEFRAAVVLQHHGDLELLRRTLQLLDEGPLGRRCGVGVAGLGAGSAIEHEGAVAHAAADDVADGEPAPALAGVGRHGDARPRRLEAEEAALGRGDADRAAAVGRMRHGEDAGDHGCRRAARGAARRVLEVPGVAGWPVEPRLGGGVEAELGRGGAAEDDEARLPAARQVGAVVVGDVVVEEAAAEAGGLALVEETRGP